MSDLSTGAIKDRPSGVDRVVDAARRVFRDQGVRETRMQDIAEAAGYSRAYVYRLVPDRDALLELAIVARCRDLAQELEAEASPTAASVTDALTAQIVAAVLRGRHDPELRALSSAMDPARASRALTTCDSPVFDLNLALFAPILGRAASEGSLRTDVTIDRMVEWIQTSMTMLTSRDDQDLEATTAMVRDFIVPAVLRPER